jgi:hypothetical protein
VTADHRITVAAVVLLAVGLLLIPAALLQWRKDRRLRAVGERTDGLVTRLRWSGGYAYPVFTFRTPDGRTFEVDSHVGTSPPPCRAGAEVRVLYDPDDPEHARIDRVLFGAGRIVLSLIVGIAFVLVAVWLLRDAR